MITFISRLEDTSLGLELLSSCGRLPKPIFWRMLRYFVQKMYCVTSIKFLSIHFWLLSSENRVLTYTELVLRLPWCFPFLATLLPNVSLQLSKNDIIGSLLSNVTFIFPYDAFKYPEVALWWLLWFESIPGCTLIFPCTPFFPGTGRHGVYIYIYTSPEALAG